MTDGAPLRARWLGKVPYQEAWALQRALHARSGDDYLLLLEHPHVYTLGRTAKAEHVLVPPATVGATLEEVDRGGDVTYHGPGQLVGYPILDLTGYKPDLHWYLRHLEQALIDALAFLGIPAERNPGFTGVWTRGRKIASIGIHVKQWVTWHGFALNVTTDLAHFERIVPCGIPGVVMTSVERESGAGSGERALWHEAVAAVIRGFVGAFRVEVRVMEPALHFPP